MINQLECERFFPNLVCTKYFCSILLTDFISSRDHTSILYLMDLPETAEVAGCLHMDVRNMRCVWVQNRAHNGIWHYLILKCHWSNDINILLSNLTRKEVKEGRMKITLLLDPTCIFALFRIIHGYKNVLSASIFNGHKNFMMLTISTPPPRPC